MHSETFLPYILPFAELTADSSFGVPDWRNPQAYPDPDMTPSHQWRWQFIRRDKSYRRTWKQFCANTEEWTDTGNGISKHDEAARRFGLKNLISPAAPSLNAHWGLDPKIPTWVVIPACYADTDVREFIGAARTRGFFLAAIDPSVALSSQVDRIQAEIASWAPEFCEEARHPDEKGRSPNKAFRLYLRLIDARDCGPKKPTWKEITETLRAEREYRSRDESSVRRSYRAALHHMAAFVAGAHKE